MRFSYEEYGFHLLKKNRLIQNLARGSVLSKRLERLYLSKKLKILYGNEFFTQKKG